MVSCVIHPPPIFHYLISFQAASAIRTWRSETGKYTIGYFDNLFAKRARELREDTAGRVAFVAAELDGMSFVYADPVNKVRPSRHSLLIPETNVP